MEKDMSGKGDEERMLGADGRRRQMESRTRRR
jgi:hypothetical protein